MQVHEHIALHGFVRAARMHKVLGLFELEVSHAVRVHFIHSAAACPHVMVGTACDHSVTTEAQCYSVLGASVTCCHVMVPTRLRSLLTMRA